MQVCCPVHLWMYRILLTLFFSVALCSVLTAAGAPEARWTRTYGDTAEDRGKSLVQTADGGYVIAGYTGRFPSYDVYLIKTNADGDTIWTRTYDRSEADIGRSVQQTSDGGYIITGLTGTIGIDSLLMLYDIYLIKTDENGDTLWTRAYDRSESDVGSSVQQLPDGGYLIAGHTGSFPEFDAFLTRTDASGDVLWTRTYGDRQWNQASSVQITADGGCIIVGNTGVEGEMGWEYDVYLIRTDANGDTLWTRTYGGENSDIGLSVQQASDMGYIIAGWTDSYGAGNQDVYVIKTDQDGDTVWTRTYGGFTHDYGYSVQQTFDGAFVVGGHTYSFGAGGRDVYVIKIDVFGDSIWARTYGGPDSEQGYSIQQNHDGGYVIAGHVWRLGDYTWNSDVYLMKTEPDTTGGNLSFHFVTAPNPSSGDISIRYVLPSPEDIQIAIYDVLGREVKIVRNRRETGGVYVVSWDGRDSQGHPVSAGVYFCRLQAGGELATRKAVIVK